MTSWTLARRITILTTLLLFFIIIITFTQRVLTSKIEVSSEEIKEQDVPGIESCFQLSENIGADQIATIQHLAALDSQEMQNFENKIKEITQSNSTLFKTLSEILTATEFQEAIQELEKKRDRYRDARTQMLQQSRSSDKAEAEHLLKTNVQPAYDAFLKSSQDLIYLIKSKIKESSDKTHRSVVLLNNVGLILGISSLAMGILF